MAKQVIPFTGRRQNRVNGYKHLCVNVYAPLETSIWTSTSPLFTMTWQAGGKNREDEWYGFTIKIQEEKAGRITEAAKQIRRLAGKKDFGWSVSPERILERFNRLGFVQYARDGRLFNKFVLIEDLKGPEYKSWRDVKDLPGTVNVLAETEDEAQQAVAESMISMKRYERLGQWIEEGRPIKELNGVYPQDEARPLAELIEDFS